MLPEDCEPVGGGSAQEVTLVRVEWGALEDDGSGQSGVLFWSNEDCRANMSAKV